MNIDYNNKAIKRTLDPKYEPMALRIAQKAELTDLIKIISGYDKNMLEIFEIGVGTARIPIALSQSYLWPRIHLYVGVEVSRACVNTARDEIKRRDIANKTKVLLLDAERLSGNPNEFLKKKYDFVLCTYFTPGNFRPEKLRFVLKNGNVEDYDRNILEYNETFVRIFKNAYRLCKKGGKVILGSIYLDNDSTRKMQEEFYRKCGMHVITSDRDSFSATREGFWSQRFTRRRIYRYLDWIERKRIRIVNLDKRNFAAMIVISK